MKQHITTDQLNELSDEAKKKLFKYGVKISHICLAVADDEFYENSVPYEKWLPLLSIGQMIEFLGDKGGAKWIKIHLDDVGPCNALWEAVKEVLNK